MFALFASDALEALAFLTASLDWADVPSQSCHVEPFDCAQDKLREESHCEPLRFLQGGQPRCANLVRPDLVGRQRINGTQDRPGNRFALRQIIAFIGHLHIEGKKNCALRPFHPADPPANLRIHTNAPPGLGT